MNRRILGIVAIVLLVSTAGCAGFLGSGGDGGDGGTTDDGEATETTMSLEDVAYPDGVTEDGFDNASAVAETHKSTLADTSFALEFGQESVEGNQSQQYDYSVRSNIETEQMVGTVTSVQELEGADESREFQNDLYQNATHRHTNVTVNGDSQVSVQEASTSFEASHESQTSASLVQNLISAGNYSATEIVDRDDTTLVRYELEEYNETEGNNLDVSDADGFILVSEAGVVHEAHLSIEGTSDGADVSYDIHLEVTQVGEVTAEPPSWVDDA